MKADGLGEVRPAGLVGLNPDGFGGLTPPGLKGRATGGAVIAPLGSISERFSDLALSKDLCTASFSMMMLVVSDGLAKTKALPTI